MGGSVEPVLDLSPDRRRPPIVYAAVGTAGALLILVVTLVALRGGSSTQKPAAEKAAPAPVAAQPAAPLPVAEKPPEPPRPPVAAKPVPPPPVEPDEPLPPPTRAAPREPAVAAAGGEPRPRRGKPKKVVLEYDRAPKAVVPPDEDPAQVERARAAYKRGNEKLFAGNSEAAVAAYKESLSIHPGYVAGYRGLGLAYAQSGQTAEALRALRTYVKTVPNAADVQLIMKRIERLEKNPQN
jgi:hypothetical protein